MVIDRLSGGKGAFLPSDSRVSFSLIGHYAGEILARRKQGARIGERPEKAARQTQQRREERRSGLQEDGGERKEKDKSERGKRIMGVREDWSEWNELLEL